GVPSGASIRAAVAEITRGRLGMTAVLDEERRVKGIFTDGDLRRALEASADIDHRRVDQAMNREPKTIRAQALAAEAVHVMEQHKISQLLVVDQRRVLVGALNMHDLFRAKVI